MSRGDQSEQPEEQERSLPRKFGPKSANHPSIGQLCKACDQVFAEGDYTTLILLGPGADPEARERAREGRVYNAIAVEVHWACATGEEGPTA